MLLKEIKLNEFARSPGDDEDTGDWNKVSFKGETVYYIVSQASFNPGYGLQVKIALRPRAVNAESEFVHDKSIDLKGKNPSQVDDEAIKLVFKYLNKHGTDALAKAMKDWQAATDEYETSRNAKLSKARTGMKTLPKGYTIVDGPKKGFRFVKTPDGRLIPNQGVNAYKTEQDIIDNFYAWQALNK
jgi:hypothetical protein